ncbi:MAG: cohesin domain-containing protein, partial [Longimicrobiales bacterium]
MTTRTRQIERSTRGLALAVLVAVGACADDESGDTLSPDMQADASLSIEVSDLNAGVGDRITLALDGESVFQLGGVQGYLRFDPDRLSFAGQLPEDGVMVIINESEAERGEIRLAAAAPNGFGDHVALFAFEVRAAGYSGGIGFEPEVVGTLNWEEIGVTVARDVGLDAGLPVAAEPVRWTYRDWAMFYDPSLEESDLEDRVARIPGLPDEGTVYGDANLNGTLNVLDFADAGNTAVGNREVLIGTDAPEVDRVTAANVRPLAAGSCEIGHSGADCAVRVVNVLDAGAIGQGVFDPEVPVVGDAIPLPKGSFAVGETVFIGADTIAGTRVFHRDTLYVLEGILWVGDDAGDSGELVVQPGTRVEGDTTSAIFVTRNGRLIADGTPTEPITFTCNSTPKFPSCWGGVFIAGNAVVNEQDADVEESAPVIPGRNPAGGQNQRRGEGSAETGEIFFGGGNDADSSGVIRYARFMYGGRQVATDSELNNLTIGGCGSGTVLSHIQVHAGTDDGLEFFGGRCNVKYLYATANDDDQFDYSFGYDGDVQFLAIQNGRVVAGGPGDKTFEVDNTETPATYNNEPRTNPQVYNVTAAVAANDNVHTHIHYRRGAGGTLRNFLLIGGALGFLIDNPAATCGNLSIDNVALLGVDTTINEACAPSVLGPNVVELAYTGQLK